MAKTADRSPGSGRAESGVGSRVERLKAAGVHPTLAIIRVATDQRTWPMNGAR